MTFKFSENSKNKLSTCHPDLQLICNRVIQIIDITIVEGKRDLQAQQKYFKEGRSKLDGINKKSKHQVSEENPFSMAVDIAPYPLDWRNINEYERHRFYYLAGIFKGIAYQLQQQGLIKHRIRWGGDWDGDNSFKDQRFNDLPHFELI